MLGGANQVKIGMKQCGGGGWEGERIREGEEDFTTILMRVLNGN